MAPRCCWSNNCWKRRSPPPTASTRWCRGISCCRRRPAKAICRSGSSMPISGMKATHWIAGRPRLERVKDAASSRPALLSEESGHPKGIRRWLGLSRRQDLHRHFGAYVLERFHQECVTPRLDPERDIGRCPNIRSSLGLINVPEHRRGRAVEHARDRFSPRADPAPLPERNIDHLVVDFALDFG